LACTLLHNCKILICHQSGLIIGISASLALEESLTLSSRAKRSLALCTATKGSIRTKVSHPLRIERNRTVHSAELYEPAGQSCVASIQLWGTVSLCRHSEGLRGIERWVRSPEGSNTAQRPVRVTWSPRSWHFVESSTDYGDGHPLSVFG
jgi:hypothetical protein